MTLVHAQSLLATAYTLNGPALDRVAVSLGSVDWEALTRDLIFQSWDTGGGCLMLLACTPSGHTIGFTDGDERLPRSERQFWLGVMDDSGHDI